MAQTTTETTTLSPKVAERLNVTVEELQEIKEKFLNPNKK